MTKDEALKLALEALEMFCEHGAILRPIETRDAIKEALAQPEQEPVAWKEAILGAISCDVGVEVPIRDYKSMNPLDCYEAGLLDGGEAVRKTIKDEVTKSLAFYSEPVAWGHPNTSITGRKQALMMVALEIPSNAQYPQMWLPLYTTPPQRKPLTDEEIINEADRFDWDKDCAVRFARAIEAAHGIKGAA